MSVWNVDAAHTVVGFAVKHMMVSNVRGTFSGIEGQVNGDPLDLANASVKISIDPNTIHTNQKDRDNHLRSEDFFHVEKYPTITFESKDIVEEKEDNYNMTGNLTIKGVTKEAVFTVTQTGKGT